MIDPDHPFFVLHDQLPREGPGDRASLDWALEQAEVQPDAVVLDAGCGPGGDVEGLLAHLPRGRVVAVDLHAPFVDAVRRRHGDDRRVDARQASMVEVEGPFDFIWCAGALYFFGTVQGLKAFCSMLVPGGVVAFSAPCWFVAEPSEVARAFWEGEDAGLLDREGLLAQVREAGFEPLADQPLPDAAWEAYYGPMEARIAALRSGASAAVRTILDQGEAEAAAWRAVRRETGYQLVVAKLA